ncbi:hypothetical protein PInf_017739 [Phytophthora infestans]|nr:hypothetical protein PInf_017739 [Phytophthora infestans]
MKAGLISDEPLRVAFAMANFGERNPLPEDVKTTVFMDGLKVGPARTQLFWVQATTLEEAIQIALQEDYSHKQAGTPREENIATMRMVFLGRRSIAEMTLLLLQPFDTSAYSEPESMDLSSIESLICCYRFGDMDPTSVYVPRQSSGKRQPVEPRSGGAGHVQVNEDSPATSRGSMLY